MKRREFLTTTAITMSMLALNRESSASKKEQPQIAITMDDFNWSLLPGRRLDALNAGMVKTLKDRKGLKIALFVLGRMLDTAKSKSLLKVWNDAGHTIGNHSFSHLNYNSSGVTFEQYSSDVARADATLKDFGRYRKLFRFPYLKEGETAEKRDRMRAFLKEQGFRTGHVTVDTSDWYIDGRMRERLAKDPNAPVAPYRDYYLDHMLERANYYNDLALKVTGRSVKHTILMHYNLLNALFLGDLLTMFENKGWKLVNAEDAFLDPVFAATPKNVPAGESVVWALAKETGKYDQLLRSPAEDGEYEKAKMDRLGL